MTLPEVLVSLSLFAVFMALYVAMSDVLMAFMGEQRATTNSSVPEQNQLALYRMMDTWVEYLSQPGIPGSQLQSLSNCVVDPVRAWGLPGPSMIGQSATDPGLQSLEGIPIGYRFCLRETPLAESKQTDLVSGRNGARPGIYVLYAIPDSITLTRLPLRRLFCRPKPFC